MKKLLTIGSLAGVLVLAACNGDAGEGPDEEVEENGTEMDDGSEPEDGMEPEEDSDSDA